jgi:hypothetical protein
MLPSQRGTAQQEVYMSPATATMHCRVLHPDIDYGTCTEIFHACNSASLIPHTKPHVSRMYLHDPV